MAIDEAISLSVASEVQLPTLRFYQWNRPTISLGYFQSIADAESYLKSFQDDASKVVVGETDAGRVKVVRRSTGGGAILHDRELTYSLALPLANSNPGPREAVYQSMHRSIQSVLARYGVSSIPYRELAPAPDQPAPDQPAPDQPAPRQSAMRQPQKAGLRKAGDEPFLCFRRRTDEDLICGGFKILGSAQRRVRGGMLQHGSLLLSVSSFAPVLPGIQELTNQTIDTSSFVDQLSQQVGAELGIQWEPGQLSSDELGQAERISQQRYNDESWTRRR